MPRPFSFTRSMRLVSARDFARTYAEGGRARGEIVVVVACPNGTQGTRLGLSVGRAIWRSAVKRNRVRRVFREAFRLSYPELPQGADVVMIPARPKLEPELAPTRAELVALAHKALARAGEKRNGPGAERKGTRAERKGPGAERGVAR
jgi:ribonuclease P protein component